MRRKAIEIIQSNNKFKYCRTLDEIESVLKNNPNNDQFIVDSLNEAGYFNHYVTLKKLYEYRYNSYSKFKEKITYCNDLDHKFLIEQLLILSKNQIEKYKDKLDCWIRKNEMLQLKFYQLNIDLCRNLICMYSILKHHCKKYNKES